MSGGYWNYDQCNLGYDMFPGCDVCYGLGDNTKSKYGSYTESIKRARQLNPMEDKQISELVFDVLCLIYSADWYKEGDTCEDLYRSDVEFFKEKWLKQKPGQLVKDEIDKHIMEAKFSLYKSFGLEQEAEA